MEDTNLLIRFAKVKMGPMTEQHCCNDCRWFKYSFHAEGEFCFKGIDVREVDPKIMDIKITFKPDCGYTRLIGSAYDIFNKNGLCPYFSHANIFVRFYHWTRKKLIAVERN